MIKQQLTKTQGTTNPPKLSLSAWPSLFIAYTTTLSTAFPSKNGGPVCEPCGQVVKQATMVAVWVKSASERLKTLRAQWRLLGLKAKVKKCCVGRVVCRAAVVRLVQLVGFGHGAV